MSYFDDASLVMIPSGYKTSKVYSVKPTDGSGDLTFSRSNDTASRIGPNGLIEKVRTNLFLQSQTFENAYWSLGNTTIAANATTAPDGTLTAEKLTATTTGVDRRIQRAESISAGIYTNSIFVKASELNLVRMYAVDFSSQATFTLTGSGTISGVIGSATAKIESVGNGWYRCSMSVSFAGGSTQTLYLNIGNALGGATINAGDGVFIWGAQLETGDIATDYIATTSAAVSVGPVANVPRLDYLNSSCPRLLLEPQRTNLTLFSEQMNNAAWTAINCTVSANAATSPDGYTNADSIATTAANSFFGAASAVTISADTSTYTQSVFIKWLSGSEIVKLRAALTGGTSVAKETIANVRTGVITYTDSTAQIVSYGNGWYRISQQITNNSTNTNFNYQFYPTNDGTNTNVISLWGAMAEVGAYASSYIPTLGAAVTRGADSTYEESSSALIGQTEGTLFAQFKGADIAGGGASRLSISSGTSANWVFVGTESNDLRAYVRANSSVIFSDTSVPQTGNDKIAIAYKSGSIALYINGAQIATSSSTFTFSATLDDITTGVGGSYSVDETLALEQLIVFPTRLSNSDLAALTA